MKRTFAGLFLALSLAPAHAEVLDFNLSNDALRGEFFGPLPNLRAQYNVGAMLGDVRESTLVHAHGGLLVTGDAGARDANVMAGLGARFAALDWKNVSGTALALGGGIEARLPAFNRIGALAHLYWGPGAASFGDLDEYLEYAVAVDYQVIRDASIYLGYRQLKVEVEGAGDFTLDNGFHFGLRLAL